MHPPALFVDRRAQEAILTMNDKRVAARTDGSLLIQVHDPETNGQMIWSRQYYVLPLEVLTSPISRLIVGKTIFP